MDLDHLLVLLEDPKVNQKQQVSHVEQNLNTRMKMSNSTSTIFQLQVTKLLLDQCMLSMQNMSF